MHRRAIKGDASVAAASRAPRSICDPDLTPLALELELPKSRQSSPVNNDRRKLLGRRKIPRRVRTLSETDDAAVLAAIGSTSDLRRAPSRRSFLSRDYFDARKLRRRGAGGRRGRAAPLRCSWHSWQFGRSMMLYSIYIINSSMCWLIFYVKIVHGVLQLFVFPFKISWNNLM